MIFGKCDYCGLRRPHNRAKCFIQHEFGKLNSAKFDRAINAAVDAFKVEMNK